MRRFIVFSPPIGYLTLFLSSLAYLIGNGGDILSGLLAALLAQPWLSVIVWLFPALIESDPSYAASAIDDDYLSNWMIVVILFCGMLNFALLFGLAWFFRNPPLKSLRTQ